MNTAMTTAQALLPAKPNKDSRSHLRRFNLYVKQHNQNILQPDLATYRDYLLETLSPSSVSAHLSSVRAAYKKLTKNRDLFYAHVPSKFADSPANQKAWVDEAIIRLTNSIDPEESKVEGIVKERDSEDDKYLRLTAKQASVFMAVFGVNTLKGLRDTAIVALMLCTGLRESEVCNLQVNDLRQKFGGELALRVNQGKGSVKRMVPYGELSWVLIIIDKWLDKAEITEGYVFRGFWKGNKRIRPGKLSTRQIQRILEDNPINIDGELTQVRPHDLRRTYAKRLWQAGMDLLAIRDNLGHANHKTTEDYIGDSDASERQPKAIYTFDLSQLAA